MKPELLVNGSDYLGFPEVPGFAPVRLHSSPKMVQPYCRLGIIIMQITYDISIANIGRPNHRNGRTTEYDRRAPANANPVAWGIVAGAIQDSDHERYRLQ